MSTFPILRRGLPAALGLFLGLGLAAPAWAQSVSPRPYFSPNGGGAEATAALLDEARSTIDVAMYSFTTNNGTPIWGAMQRAIARGVRVRVVLHDAKRSNKSKADALAGIGAHVFGVSRTMHQKFAIIDGATTRRRLVNGSANWSTGAMTRYSENTVIFRSHLHLVHAFAEEFNRLLAAAEPLSAGAEAQMDPLRTSRPSPLVRRYEQAIFTSTNQGSQKVATDTIIAAMRAAQRSIAIDVAHFNSRDLAQTVIDLRRSRPDLKIEVLLDLGQYSDSKSRAKDLERAGVSVRYKTYSLVYLHPRAQLMHHKTVIIDEQKVIAGSFNWSDTAENTNYENLMVIEGTVSRNRACVAAYVAEHKKLWDLNRDVYPAFARAMRARPGDAGYKKIIPVHFDTQYFNTVMTLTRGEIAPMRSVAFASGIITTNPGGGNTYHNDSTYLDREAKRPHTGNVSGRFLDLTPVVGDTTGIIGGIGEPDPE